MIRSFFMLGAFFCSLTCMAGMPEQDPTIKALREQFSLARAPIKEELQAGRMFSCEVRSAVRNDFTIESKSDFLQFRDVGLGDYLAQVAASPASLFSLGKAGAAGAYLLKVAGVTYTYHFYLRIDSGEVLLGELSVLIPVRGGGKINMADSLIDPAYKADSYFVCSPN